jgi:hypothetical protein
MKVSAMRRIRSASVIARIGFLSIFLFIAVAVIAFPTGASNADARRLRVGRFTYRDRQDGKDVGGDEIVIQFLSNSNYAFSAKITGAFRQCWESVAASDMSAISASLSMGEEACVTPRFELRYGSGRATGFSVSNNADAAPVRRSVDEAVPAGTIDQRIDWAYVMATDLRAGQTFRFAVYDPVTGVSQVAARVGPVERVEVPAGAFDVYRISYEVSKSRGVEAYVLFASAEIPRVMVREDFSNHLVSELVSMQASER